jgi:hypothetical protein
MFAHTPAAPRHRIGASCPLMDRHADDKVRRSVVVSRQEAVEFVRDLLLAAPEIPQVDSEVVHRLLQRISIPLGVDRIKCRVDCCGFPVGGQSGIEVTQLGQRYPQRCHRCGEVGAKRVQAGPYPRRPKTSSTQRDCPARLRPIPAANIKPGETAYRPASRNILDSRGHRRGWRAGRRSEELMAMFHLAPGSGLRPGWLSWRSWWLLRPSSRSRPRG